MSTIKDPTAEENAKIVDSIIVYLNEILQLDPDAVYQLIETGVSEQLVETYVSLVDSVKGWCILPTRFKATSMFAA